MKSKYQNFRNNNNDVKEEIQEETAEQEILNVEENTDVLETKVENTEIEADESDKVEIEVEDTEKESNDIDIQEDSLKEDNKVYNIDLTDNSPINNNVEMSIIKNLSGLLSDYVLYYNGNNIILVHSELSEFEPSCYVKDLDLVLQVIRSKSDVSKNTTVVFKKEENIKKYKSAFEAGEEETITNLVYSFLKAILD